MLELRVASLLVLAAYLFAIDAAVLAKFDLGIAGVFGYHTPGGASPLRVAHLLLFALAAGSTAYAAQELLFPALETRLVALATLVLVLGILLRQQRLRRVLARVALGGISAERRLGDILVSDALVSMANVFVDVVAAFNMSWYRARSSQPMERSAFIGQKTLLVASIPSGIRVKQCVIDYRRTRDKTHLLNLLKYVIGNLPHALRVQIAPLGDTPAQKQLRAALLYWLGVALAANAAYSLVWDTVVDWRLGRLRGRGGPLRFPRWTYVAAAAADTVLRFSFLAATPEETRIYTLQALELVRRGMWVVFRVESEPLELADSIEMQAVTQ